MDSASASFATLPDSVWLLLDASGPVMRTGLWQSGRWLAFQENSSPALDALFADTRKILDEIKLPFENVGGFLYVEGPGSVLGLRVAAMAIRAWQTTDAAKKPASIRSVWACGSLHLAAALAIASGQKQPFSICTEARQGFWHLLEVSDENLSAKNISVEISGDDLEKHPKPLFHIPSRKAWRGPPEGSLTIKPSLRDHPEILSLTNLCRPVPQPAPWTGREPEYKLWNNPAAPNPSV